MWGKKTPTNNEFKPPYLFYFKDASPACYSKVTSSKHKHAYMPELFFLVERVKMEHFV